VRGPAVGGPSLRHNALPMGKKAAKRKVFTLLEQQAALLRDQTCAPYFWCPLHGSLTPSFALNFAVSQPLERSTLPT
jgi:hypothetical protein